MADDEQPDYRKGATELAARKGFRVYRGPRDDSPLTIHIEDRETGELIFSSPSFEHAYGHLQKFRDRPPSA